MNKEIMLAINCYPLIADHVILQGNIYSSD